MSNTRELTPGMVTGFTNNVVRPVLLFQMDTSAGTVYIWSGIGNLVWNGITFIGAGALATVDVIPETTDLSANGVTVALSGIPSSYLALALESIENRYNATLWFGLFDDNLNLIADPYQVYQGITDVPTITEGTDTCKITITIENRFSDLNRARTTYYTPQDQALIDATDKGFDYVAGLQNASVIFG
jgi:hypothetical protein